MKDEEKTTKFKLHTKFSMARNVGVILQLEQDYWGNTVDGGYFHPKFWSGQEDDCTLLNVRPA